MLSSRALNKSAESKSVEPVLRPTPISALDNIVAYRPVDRLKAGLYLNANEGPATGFERYPNAQPLIAALAERFSVEENQVAVGAGGDDIIDQVMRSFLDETRTLTIAAPTFEMIPKLATATGARINRVDWSDKFPLQAVLAASRNASGVIAIVTPNNPTGVTVPFQTVLDIAIARPECVILLDLAYIEYADADPTPMALTLPNVIVVRTFSKAWGLAGLRCGYALAQPELISALLKVGSPYPLSTPTITAALTALGSFDIEGAVMDARTTRDAITNDLKTANIETSNSEANFVYGTGAKAAFLCDALSAQNVFCRRFSDGIRITVPTTTDDKHVLENAINQALRPNAILFDMDGVLVDVSNSYRQAIIQSCASFDVTVNNDDIDALKLRGNANDDWQLTQTLLAERGVNRPLQDIVGIFEGLYQGGLWKNETAILETDLLRSLKLNRPLGVVTGRPKLDAERAIELFGWANIFDVVVTREDAPLKPSPEPVMLALQELDAATAWFIGDSPDDIESGYAANVLAIGSSKDDATRQRLAALGAPTFSSPNEVLKWL